MNTKHDQVVFENIPDQYAKGEDVKVQFTTVHEISTKENEDQIAILRVGSANIQECLVYAPVEIESSVHHGKATFPSSCLPTTDDEFYQFVYLSKKRKCLGSSIPFQLNCSIVDIDLLSQAMSDNSTQLKSASDALIAFNDHDNEDLLVIHTKTMLVEEKLRQENRQLVELNRRLEKQKDECKTKLDELEIKSNEYITKTQNELQNLSGKHKATIEELSTRQRLEAKLRAEYDACRALCNQYQSEALQFAERCRVVEETNAKLSTENNRLRSQMTMSKQLVEEQNVQILDLEKHLSESSDALKAANQYQTQLEQQLRDLRLTNEKYQLSMQGQVDIYTKQISQQEDQLHALESANSLLKEELNSMKNDNIFLVSMTKQDKHVAKELQQEIQQITETYRNERDQLKKEMDSIRKELDEAKVNEQNYNQLKISFNEIEKRCVKHQKSEIDVKKQLTAHKEFINELQQQIQDLTERLLAGSDEYKTLYRKYATLQRSLSQNNQPTTLSNETGLNEEALVTLLRNSYELQQQKDDENDDDNENEDEDEETKQDEKDNETKQTPIVTEEIRECPMCYWEFPKHFTLEGKKEHIENHFA